MPENSAVTDRPADAGALGRRIIRGMIVIIFFGLFTLLGVAIYERMIEGGGWR
jgi:hypothetical protein